MSENVYLHIILLSAIGIIVVFGFLVMWKSMRRIEDRLQSMSTAVPASFYQDDEIDIPNAQLMVQDMKEVFGTPQQTVMIASTTNEQPTQKQPDVDVQESNAVVESKTEPVQNQVTKTEYEIRKNKLMKNSVDELKVICQEKNLSSDGQRKVLVERILEAEFK